MIYDILIVGAGVTGAMAARELSRYDLSVCLLEAANDVACGASRANSGIVHGGFDPEPGTLKARLNVEGVPLLYEAARQLHVPVQNNGSLVCAFSEEELPALRALYDRGLRNGVEQLALLTGDEAQALEPNLSPAVTGALLSPTAGIICPYELTIAAAGCAMDNGVELKRNFRVASVQKNGVFTVTAESGAAVQGRFLLNCAGGHADEVARLCGDGFFTIQSRAGEYLLLDKTEGGRVRHTIFQLPSQAGKGVLVTPTVDGNLLTGPTASAVASPESRDTTPAGLDQVRRLAAKSVPSVDFRQVITSFTGVRASEAGGDFILRASEAVPGLIHAAAIDSPGLTCCVAIARYLVELLRESGLTLTEKPGWTGLREDPHAFRHMTEAQQDAFIREHPDYGRIVCRCETVSEGEIRAAIRRNPQAWDVDGVKRRTRAGMGRCQGGFCGPAVLRLLSQELGVPMETITKHGPGSGLLAGRIGETQ